MKKDNNIVWRLLRRNISTSQIVGYAVANLVGLAIVMTAIQLYRDISAVWDSEDGLITTDYLIISRKVKGFDNVLQQGESGFTAADIADIEAQGWAKRIGKFAASRFHVNGSVEMAGRGMSTYMFFEAIPDDFIDVKPDGWGFDPAKPEIPIILSRDYLALYNFGFAATRGFPQISEQIISTIPLSVSISGNGKEATFPARIVGFSSRLNTIAVPQSFMDWANERYAAEPEANPSRLILEVSDPGDPRIAQYLDEHEYETAGDKSNAGKASHFFTVMTSVVVAVGAIISVLAFFILMLSIYLLIQKNRQKLRDLMLLGYRPAQVAKYYIRLVVVTNACVLVAASGAVVAGSLAWAEPIKTLGGESAPVWGSLAIGAAMVVLITVINILTIRRLTLRALQ